MRLDEAIILAYRKGHKRCTFVSVLCKESYRLSSAALPVVFGRLCFDPKYTKLLKSNAWAYIPESFLLRNMDDHYCELILDKIEEQKCISQN